MAAEDHLAAEPARGADHAMQVPDRDAHPPAFGELHLRVGDELEVRLERRVLEPAQVVVVQLRRGRPAGLGAVEFGLILQQVLPSLHGPHLPALLLGHDPLGQGHEIGRARRRARLEHEHVARCGRADLDHAHSVVLRRGPGRGDPAHPVHLQGSAGGACWEDRQRCEGGWQQLHQRAHEATSIDDLHRCARS